LRIGYTGLEPLPILPTMKKHNQKDLTQVKGGYVGAGSTFERVGSFVFMNITKPKPIPADICNRCLEELENQIIQLEVEKQACTDKDLLPVFNYEMRKLALQEVYYKECKRLFEKGQMQ
jgi:hypothetical protein